MSITVPNDVNLCYLHALNPQISITIKQFLRCSTVTYSKVWKRQKVAVDTEKMSAVMFLGSSTLKS